MVVTRIDNDARRILEEYKEIMKGKGIAHPNLSDAIRYMNTQIEGMKNE